MLAALFLTLLPRLDCASLLRAPHEPAWQSLASPRLVSSPPQSHVHVPHAGPPVISLGHFFLSKLAAKEQDKEKGKARTDTKQGACSFHALLT